MFPYRTMTRHSCCTQLTSKFLVFTLNFVPGKKKTTTKLFKDAEKWATRVKTCNCMEFGDLPVYNQSGEISARTGERQKPAQNACAVPEERLNREHDSSAKAITTWAQRHFGKALPVNIVLSCGPISGGLIPRGGGCVHKWWVFFRNHRHCVLWLNVWGTIQFGTSKKNVKSAFLVH